MPNQLKHMYAHRATPVMNPKSKQFDQVKLVSKYRGDNDPFQSNVGDFVTNQTKHDGSDVYIDHGQQISLNDYNKVLKLNHKDVVTQDIVNDKAKHHQSLLSDLDNVAYQAPVKDDKIDIHQLQAPDTPFNYQIQKSLEDHSKSAHSMLNALTLVNDKAASKIKSDSKYQFGQYNDKVVDEMPKDYFQHHPLPIGPVLSNSEVKTMLYNGHTLVMNQARQQTNQAVAEDIVKNGGSLLASRDATRGAKLNQSSASNSTIKPKKKKKTVALDPLAANTQLSAKAKASAMHAGNVTNSNVQPNSNVNTDAGDMSVESSLSPHAQINFAIEQRFQDHKRLDGDSDNDAASVFEDDYEPKDLADAQSTLNFDKQKKKLGLGDENPNTKRTKYLTNLLTTQNTITRENDDSALAAAENSDSDTDDVDVDARDSDAIKKARLERKQKMRKRSVSDKKKKQLELYAESIYAMQYHDDHGVAKLQYNIIPRELPVAANNNQNAYVSTADFHDSKGKIQQTHSMPISEQTFKDILTANGAKVLTQAQIEAAVKKNQPLAGKRDNLAFKSDLQKSPHGTKIKEGSISEPSMNFDYQKDVEDKLKNASAQKSEGLVKNPNAKPRPFKASSLPSPYTHSDNQVAAHASLNHALDQAIQQSNTKTHQVSWSLDRSTLGK